jgi:hypothetical protein
MRRLRARWSILLLFACVACGGGKSSSSGSKLPPTPTPTPPANPCAALAQEETEEEEATAEAQAYSDAKRLPRVDSDPRWSVLNSLWQHAAAGRFALPLAESGTHSQDVGNVAVIQDPGDIIVSANLFDLQNLNLKFTRNGSSYDVTRTNTGFRSTLGDRITLSDDDTSQFTMPFAFSFYGKDQTQAFLNSDGNITFEQADTASTDRSVSRFLTGTAARGAVLLGSRSVHRQRPRVPGDRGRRRDDHVVQRPCVRHGADRQRAGRAPARRQRGIPLRVQRRHQGRRRRHRPGHSGQFQPVDLSTTGPVSSSVAIGERFSASPMSTWSPWRSTSIRRTPTTTTS